MSTDATAPPRRPSRLVREGLLWVFAAVGVVCLLCTIAALLFGMTPLIFRSGSMSPVIPTGSLAIAVKTPAVELSVGDIVSVHWSDGTRVTHRLVDLLPGFGDARTLVTRGDANRVPDAESVVVDSADVVVWHVPELGFWLEEAMKPQYVFAAGVVIGGLIVLAFRSPTGRPARRHNLAATGAVLALVIGCAGPLPSTTLATFSDANSVSGSFASGSIHAPTNLTCVITGGFLSPKTINLGWTAPVGGVAPTGYDVSWTPLTGGAAASTTVTGTSTTVSPSLLSLAVTYEFSVRAKIGNWMSPPISRNVLATTSLLVACL